MKIAIIADSIDESFSGTKTYAEQLITALGIHCSSHTYTLIHIRPNVFFNNFEQKIIRDIRIIPFYGLFRKFVLIPRYIRKQRFDLVHDLGHMAPCFFSSHVPTIVTVHDCTPFLFPQFHTEKTVWGHRLFFPSIVRHARHIIAVSIETKNDLLTLFPFLKGKITVIPLGVGKSHTDAIRSIRYIMNIEPYILFVGTLEPRKNLPLLLRAYEQLKEYYNIPHKLLIIGRKGWKYKKIIRAVRQSKWCISIFLLHAVHNDALPAYYRRASVFVYPSYYEGFGLPPLEAMSYGCPVVESDVPGLRSVSGQGALLCKSDSVEDLVSSIYTVVSDETYRNKLIRKGNRIARQYTWEKTAQKTKEIYTLTTTI